jgi:DUF1009 family protein
MVTKKITLPNRVGLIAGKGMFPVTIALKIKNENADVYAVGFVDITDRILKEYVKELNWVKLGQLEAIIEYFKSHRINKAVMGGLIKHNRIFDSKLLDNSAEKMFARMKDQRADSILGVFAEELKKENIELISAVDIIPENIVGEGLITKNTPDNMQIEDMNFGAGIAKKTAGLDIGQTVVVKNKAIIAVEAMEGTDRCILRAGELAGPDTVVVKVAKPEQDLRFDMPVIGIRTIETMGKARAKILAVEAGKAIIFDKAEVIKKANEYNIIIAGITVK